MLELIHETYAAQSLDQRISANRLMAILEGRRAHEPRAALVTTASGGGKSPARIGAINWHLDQLRAVGVLRKMGRHYHLLPSASDDAGHAAPPGGIGPS